MRDIDLSKTAISYKSERLDLEIEQADFSDPAAISQTLYHKYGSFWCAYLEDILRIGPCLDDSSIAVMNDFVNDEFVSAEFAAIREIHKVEQYDEDIEKALRYWNYYFPDSVVPRVVYFNSAFNASIYSTDSVIGVALDFYLGKKHPIVEQLQPELFPQYIKDNMDPVYLVPDAMKDWLFRKTNAYAPLPGEGNLLDQLVYVGKVMYLLDAMMPFTADSVKINWTDQEMKWAGEYEGNIWKELARQEVLFNKVPFENQKWLINGPFTNTGSIPQESPPQLGLYMGWQFVRAYMKSKPELTLHELLAEKNSQVILKAYHPPG